MSHAVSRTVWETMGLLLFALPAAAQSLFHRAENQVQVVLVKIVRTASNTEIQLQTQKAMTGICWYENSDNSPYLLADGQRLRYLGGANVTPCPGKHSYASQEIMILRFEPLPAQTRMFSLVEGRGGENQMIDPKSSKETFWNFLRIKLD
ncbi:MAG: hypothetical protein ABI830_13585 [Pseudolabrys sp.]